MANSVPMVVIIRLDRIIQFFYLDCPIKRLCRNYLKCEFVILNEVKNLTKSMRYKTKILRLGPQNDNYDADSKSGND
jgi:hypothetical protein